jgi:hypothetical protein
MISFKMTGLFQKSRLLIADHGQSAMSEGFDLGFNRFERAL